MWYYDKKHVRAKIVDNLLEKIEEALPEEGHRNDKEFLKLLDRIQGKEVFLSFLGQDAFEEIDNNYWITDNCYTILDVEG